MLRRLLDWLAPIDPNPEPSQLDRWDRVERCSVIGCPNEPTTAPHGWAVCPEHCPSMV